MRKNPDALRGACAFKARWARAQRFLDTRRNPPAPSPLVAPGAQHHGDPAPYLIFTADDHLWGASRTVRQRTDRPEPCRLGWTTMVLSFTVEPCVGVRPEFRLVAAGAVGVALRRPMGRPLPTRTS